jgi:hypothetical protein
VAEGKHSEGERRIGTAKRTYVSTEENKGKKRSSHFPKETIREIGISRIVPLYKDCVAALKTVVAVVWSAADVFGW